MMCDGIRISSSATPSHTRLVFENSSPSRSDSGCESPSLLPRTMICSPALRIGCENSNSTSRAAVIEIAATPISALFDRTSSSSAPTLGAGT